MGDDEAMPSAPVLSKPWLRRLLIAGTLFAAWLLWKAVLLQGPALAHQGTGAPPALFKFQARGLIQAEVGYPRGLEATIPAPQKGSNAAAQLQLMGLWDGRVWTQKGVALGHLGGRDLKVRLGHLALARIQEVTPARDYNGATMCQVDYRARWVLPDAEAELLRLQPLTGLRLPAGVPLRMPGQELDQQVTLERTGLGWKVQDVSKVRGEAPGEGRRLWVWLAWVL